MKDIVEASMVGWLNNVPKDWVLLRVKNLFELSKEKNTGELLPVLSLTQRVSLPFSSGKETLECKTRVLTSTPTLK